MVVLYAAFLGILLASYVHPSRTYCTTGPRSPPSNRNCRRREHKTSRRSALIKELQTPAGIERAAREHYGMIRPGEKVYIVPSE